MAGAVAVSVGLGAWAWAVWEDGPDAPLVLPAAVTEEPELAWTWDAQEPIYIVTPMGEDAVVAHLLRELVALDADDGDVRWRHQITSIDTSYDAESDAIISTNLVDEEGMPTLTSLDAETGEEMWSVPGWRSTTVGDATLVTGPDWVRRIDSDGSEIWSMSIEGSMSSSEDAIYAFQDGDLHAWDLDGQVVWVSDSGVMGSRKPGVVVLDDFVAVTGPGSEVVGLDLETGTELWRADAGPAGRLGTVGSDLALAFPAINQASGSISEESGILAEGAVYDRDGEVASLEGALGPLFFPVAIELDGTRHVFEKGSGRLYDENFKYVGTVPIDGRAHHTLTGAYDVVDGAISYIPYDEDKAVWSLEGPFGNDNSLALGEEFLLSYEKDTLSLYR